jgi:hypothetical protein
LNSSGVCDTVFIQSSISEVFQAYKPLDATYANDNDEKIAKKGAVDAPILYISCHT